MIVAFLGHTYFLFDKIARRQRVVNFIKRPNSVEVDQDLHRLSIPNKSKKGGKDQETIQLSSTPDPGYHKGNRQKYNKHHHQEPRGQPFPSR